jgi:thiol-disulfide isomerase/thioredoxin
VSPRKRASPLAVVVLAAVFAALVALLLPSHRPALAADLRLALLDGRITTLAEFRGRPVLVTFWATDCAPCMQELPDLIALYNELGPHGLEILAVAMPHDPPLNVRSVVRQRGVPYPVAFDIEGRVGRAFGGVDVIPTAFVLDPEGRVMYRHAGKLDLERTRRAVAPYLDDVQTRAPAA